MDKNMKTIKNMKGITLIALVVTIVVLLILAGVTISTLFGDNGIITAARKAEEETQKSEEDTEKAIENLEDYMSNALAKDTNKGDMVDIKEKYAKYTDNTSSDVVPIPGGYGVVKDSTTNTNNKNTIASGLVISDLANDTLDNFEINGKRGNQFVWVPVSETQIATMYGTDSSGKKHGKLYRFESNAPQKLNWEEINGVMNISSESDNYREPDVLRESENYYDASNTYLSILGLTSINEFEIELQTSFDNMIKSVSKYKGFYIGRYETGNLESNIHNVPVVKKGATVGEANWYYQYATIKNMAKDNKNITISMIWGCQWDRTLDWIAQTNQKNGKPDYSLLTNSSSWGNYSNYKATTGDNSIQEAGTKILPSGSNEAWQKNHIYDLAGNARDWTIEARGNDIHTNNRVNRGSDVRSNGSMYSVSYRSTNEYPLYTNGSSSRTTLYVKL